MMFSEFILEILMVWCWILKWVVIGVWLGDYFR